MSDDELVERIIALKKAIKSDGERSLNRGLKDLGNALHSPPKVNSITDVRKNKGADSFTILTEDSNIQCTCSTKGALPVTIAANQENIKVSSAGNFQPYTAPLTLTANVPITDGTSKTCDGRVTLAWPVGQNGTQGNNMVKPPVKNEGVTYYDDAKTRVKLKFSQTAKSASVTGVSGAITGLSAGITGANVSIGAFDHVFRGGQLSANAFSVDWTGNERAFATKKDAVCAAVLSAIPVLSLVGLARKSTKVMKNEA